MKRTISLLLAVILLFGVLPIRAHAEQTNPFTDVKTTDYFYEAVLWAVEKKSPAAPLPPDSARRIRAPASRSSPS